MKRSSWPKAIVPDPLTATGPIYGEHASNWVSVWRGGSIFGENISVARSTNSGATWSAEAALTPISTLGNDRSPRISTDRVGNWVAVWMSTNNLGFTVGNDLDIFISRSSDNGLTWSTQKALNSDAASTSSPDLYAEIATDRSGNWIAVWYSINNRLGANNGDYDIVYSSSTDDGATWAQPETVNPDPVTDTEGDQLPDIATDVAGNWVAVWERSFDIAASRLVMPTSIGIGALSVYDYLDDCDENGRVLLDASHPDRVTIEGMRNVIELYVQNQFGRVGWSDEGGPIEFRIRQTCKDTGQDVDWPTSVIWLEKDIDLELDRIAHEYYHGVTKVEALSGTSPDICSESVGESLSDIFAVAIDSTPEDDDPEAWIVGECPSCGILLPPFNNVDERDFRDEFNMSDDWGSNKYTNAQIHNHAVYLWTRDYLEGDRDKMARVFYYALDYLPTDCNFTILRQAAVAAATDLGLSPQEIQGLESSYDAVGIGIQTDPVWVDFTHVGQEIGSQSLPFRCLCSAINHLLPGGTLKLKPVDWPDAPYLSTPMRLEAIGGTASIGNSAERNAGAFAEEGFISQVRIPSRQ